MVVFELGLGEGREAGRRSRVCIASVAMRRNSSYDSTGRGRNPWRMTSGRASRIVMATTAGDVARTILFARDHDLAFAARCGGHSYGGYSLSDGIVIDVSAMAMVRIGAGTATIGAGARVIDVAAGLATVGAVIPVGTCATVGISGLTLGGGQGVVGRRFGLTCDSLQAATVVLADGRIVTCDASKDADLFWALRGAGGGNLGVVTSFTFASHPLGAITAFSMSWPWSNAGEVVAVSVVALAFSFDGYGIAVEGHCTSSLP